MATEYERVFICAECKKQVVIPHTVIEWGWNIGSVCFCGYKCMMAYDRRRIELIRQKKQKSWERMLKNEANSKIKYIQRKKEKAEAGYAEQDDEYYRQLKERMAKICATVD